MPYLPTTALSADEAAGTDLLTAIDKRTLAMQKAQQDADRWRKWSTIIGAASALFAAGKLGIIAIPHIRRMRSARAMGTLGATPNPRRRRR